MESAQIEQSAFALKSQHKATLTGQWLGFSMGCVAMIGAGIMAWINQPWIAGVFLAVPVMGVAKALVESAFHSWADDGNATVTKSMSAANTATRGEKPDGSAPG